MKQVAQRVLQAIAAGEFELGEPLPSPPQLARLYDSDVRRVEAALLLLEKRGYVRRHSSLGWVVAVDTGPTQADLDAVRRRLDNTITSLIESSDLPQEPQ